jgi:multidrug efflux system membrane fusion protein
MNELKRNAFSDRLRLDGDSLRRTPLWMRLGAILLGLFVVVVIVLVALHYWTTTTARGRGAGQNGPVPVNVATVAQGDVNVTIDGLGAVTPLATVTVHAQVSGYLNKFDVVEGQMVKAGQLLAEIDPRPFQATLDQAKGQLARDQATLAKDTTDLGRYQALWQQKAISQQIYQDQIGTVGADKGTVVADKAAVETDRINLEFCSITSPVAGRVGLRQVDPGNLVSNGATAIVVVTQLQPMSVLFSVPEDSISQVMQQVNAGAKLSTTAYDRSMTTKIADGSLSNVDNEIDPTTGMVKMRAMFDNTNLTLFPSQFVNIRLLLTTLHDQTYVPAAAIQHGAQGTYVYSIDKNHTANMQAVTTGPTDGDKVAITKGLSPGDIVVTDGADRLSDGKAVLLPGTKAATGGAYSAPATQPAAGTGTGKGKWKGQHRHGHHHHQQGGDQSKSQGGSP